MSNLPTTGAHRGVNMDNAGTIKEAVVEAEPHGAATSDWRKRITITSVVIVLIAAAVVLPPLINLGRYQRQVTTLVSRSLDRPVQLSSVGLQLLPRPGFILHDLAVAEDPAFGAEPVLSARTVVASIAVTSLWKGKLAIDRVSVDEASLNLVVTGEGRWNLESLLTGAQPSIAPNTTASDRGNSGKPTPFPYLEATNSRVNLKRGSEKTSFSVVNTDLSLWQDDPGQWRVRLRGQPVRTDIEMSWADTGEVRLEASLHAASQLRDMPLRLQMEWRDAHLGQLSRLILGSDAGWRGDLTADIDVQGTANSAQTKARLQATGVRRQEFAPETPLDLDTNCSFVYQHSETAFRNILCDSALGKGKLHLKAELPGKGQSPQATIEVKQVPVQAALDLLRTVRGGFAPGISAKGTADGSLSYRQQVTQPNPSERPQSKALRSAKLKKPAMPTTSSEADNWQGSLIVSGATLKGGELKEPLSLPAMTWVPVLNPSGTNLEARLVLPLPSLPSSPTRANIAAKPQNVTTPAEPESDSATPETESATAPKSTAASPPLAITVKLDINRNGYYAAATGSAATEKLRSLAYAFGLPHLDALDALTGDNPELNVAAAGPWLVVPRIESTAVAADSSDPSGSNIEFGSTTPSTDAVSGTVQIHHAQWKPAYLSRTVFLHQLTVTLNGSSIAMTSDFVYGGATESITASNDALRGKVAVANTASCNGPDCQPALQLRFGALAASSVQAALIGAKQPKASLMDKVRDRIHASDKPAWPTITLQVTADSLDLGRTILGKPSAKVKIDNHGDLELTDWTVELLGGTASGTGSLQLTSGKPEYAFDGTFQGLIPTAVGALIGNHLSGNPLQGSGKINLSGLDWKDLAASATGDLQFTWPSGSLTTVSAQSVRFQNWTGSLSIQGGKAKLTSNSILVAKKSAFVEGAIDFGGETQLSLTDGSSQVASQAPTKPPAANQPSPK